LLFLQKGETIAREGSSSAFEVRKPHDLRAIGFSGHNAASGDGRGSAKDNKVSVSRNEIQYRTA
jgi:hypothetical protein